MLKNCVLSKEYDKLLNKTCGEIVCQSETSFIIICNFCNIKLFEFKEFVQHFCNTHWPDINPENNAKTIEQNEETHLELKDNKPNLTEAYANEQIVYEEYVLKEIDKEDEEEEIKDQDEWLLENDEDINNISEDNDESNDLLETKFIIKKKENKFQCNQCSRSFTHQKLLDQHKARKHIPKQYKCNKCPKSFNTAERLTSHLQTHNGYACKVCHKVYEKKTSLRYHKDTQHIETKDFICDFKNCNKAFVNKHRLAAHKRSHILETRFVCEICGSKQRDKIALTDHIRSHSGEKPFACSVCDRRFGTKSLLGEHKACHETERKHVCDVCGKSFNRPKALYHHKHLHLGVKKFVCKICGRAYAQAAGLSAHMRKHKEQMVNTTEEFGTSDIYNVLFPNVN